MKFQVFGDIVTPVRFESSEISVSLARILEVLQKLENAGIIRPDDVLGMHPGQQDGKSITFPVVEFDVQFTTGIPNCQITVDGEYLTFSDYRFTDIRDDIWNASQDADLLDEAVTRFVRILKMIFGVLPAAVSYKK